MLMNDSGTRYIEINSALVSAQQRKRFYVHNCGAVNQPGDRGIMLKDVLESGMAWQDKSYCLTASYPHLKIFRKMKKSLFCPCMTASQQAGTALTEWVLKMLNTMLLKLINMRCRSQ